MKLDVGMLVINDMIMPKVLFDPEPMPGKPDMIMVEEKVKKQKALVWRLRMLKSQGFRFNLSEKSIADIKKEQKVILDELREVRYFLQSVRKHAQHVSVLRNRDRMARKLNETFTVMKLGGSFTGKEIKMLADRAANEGWILQWDVSRAHSGGRGMKSWGKLEFGRTQVVVDILKELKIYDEYMTVPIEKRINYISKIFAECHEFKVKPKVKIGFASREFDGLIYVKPSWAESNGIQIGDKTCFVTKSLMVPLPALEWMDFDILINPDENKFNLTEDQLSENMAWNPNLGPKALFSRYLNRNPKFKWDLLSLLNVVPLADLSAEKRIYETGVITDKEIDEMFGYGPEDDRKMRPTGLHLLAGESVFRPDIWRDVAPILFKRVMSHHHVSVEGYYGPALPMELLNLIPHEGAEFEKLEITRSPGVVNPRDWVGIFKGCLFTNEFVWMTVHHGDFDGDQMQGTKQQSVSLNLDVDDPKVRELLLRITAVPEKKPAKFDGMSELEVVAVQLDQLAGTGIVHYIGKVVVEGARAMGWDSKAIVELDTRIASEIVQSYIDGQKYDHAKTLPSLYDVCKRYGVDYYTAKEVKGFYQAVRGARATMSGLIAMAGLANADSPVYYERVVAKFKDWEIGKYEPVKTISERFSKKVIRSKRRDKDLDLRYEHLKKYLYTDQAIDGVIRFCMTKYDVKFAQYLQAKKEIKEV